MVYDNPVTGVRRYQMEMLELPQGLLLEFVTDLMTQHPTGCLRVAESTLTPFVPERSDLNATIAVAEALTEGDYTAETWAALVDALEKARTVAADEAATQTQVDDAATGLAAAIQALVEKVTHYTMSAVLSNFSFQDVDNSKISPIVKDTVEIEETADGAYLVTLTIESGNLPSFSDYMTATSPARTLRLSSTDGAPPIMRCTRLPWFTTTR